MEFSTIKSVVENILADVISTALILIYNKGCSCGLMKWNLDIDIRKVNSQPSPCYKNSIKQVETHHVLSSNGLK